jgi:stage V sporulation protein G
MPSRKLTAHCPQCGSKNHLRAAYCNQCGLRLKDDRALRDEDGRAKLYADIAHPINSACRESIQHRVIQVFHDELERSKVPGYVSNYEDFGEEQALARPAEERHGNGRGARSTAPAPHITPAATTPMEASPTETARVQSREAEPRAPHVPAPTPITNPVRRTGEFGAGIF